MNTEDPQNPLLSGIPYDQYKAQIQTEQKKRSVEEADLKQKEVVEQGQMMKSDIKNKAATDQGKVESKTVRIKN